MKTMLVVIGLLVGVVNAPAQTWSFGGHIYVKLGALSLADARSQAAQLGGHLLVVNDAAEYAFVDSTLCRRGDGWSWTGVAERGGQWAVDGGSFSGVLAMLNNHWNGTIQQTPMGPGAVVVMGKLQITYRSTKWVAKLYQFSGSFAAGQLAQTIVEIE